MGVPGVFHMTLRQGARPEPPVWGGREGSHQKAGSTTRPCSFCSPGRISCSEEGKRARIPGMEGTGKPFL